MRRARELAMITTSPARQAAASRGDESVRPDPAAIESRRGACASRRARALVWLDSIPLWSLLAAVSLVALASRVATALQFAGPMYTDTAYYTTVARTLANGGGLTDHSYWNYLYTAPGLAHPSNGYWLPLASLVVAPFLWLFGDSFAAAEIAPILSSVGFVLVGFWVGVRLLGDRWGGVLVASWTLAGGFFAAHATFADTFSPYSLLGSIAFAATIEAMRGSRKALLVAGVAAGLSMLTRSEAALLPATIVVGWAWAAAPVRAFARAKAPGFSRAGAPTRDAAPPWPWLVAALALCAAVVLPWYLRNVAAFGSLSAPGSSHVLFLTRYDDLFRWRVDIVTAGRFLAQGPGALLSSRLEAAARSAFVVALAANFLWLPFAAVGVWCARRRPWLVPPATYFLLLVVAMTLALPYPAEHGTLIHALAPLEPWIGVCGVLGLRAGLRRVGRGHAMPRYEILGVVYAVFFSAAMVWMAATSWYSPSNRPDYARIEAEFLRPRAAVAEPVLVIDPPVFEYETGRPGLVLPTEGPSAAIDIARRFGARYLVWDGRAAGDSNPYLEVAQDSRFVPRATIGRATIYEIAPSALR